MSRKTKRTPWPTKKPTKGNPPRIRVLEQFTNRDLDQWRNISRELTAFENNFFSAVEAQRRPRYQRLINELNESKIIPLHLNNWWRIVDEKYSSSPLDSRGSLLFDGGRFNCGKRINEREFVPFPALYVGNSFECVYFEKFESTVAGDKGLAGGDFLLNPTNSFTSYRLKINLERVFDLRDLKNLVGFVKVLRGFTLPKHLIEAAKELDVPSPTLVKSPFELMTSFMHKDWRTLPSQFNLPANSQIFGKMLVDAGIEGVIYNSSKGHGVCLAVYPQNFEQQSYIEVEGDVSDNVKIKRLDVSTFPLLNL